MTYRSYTVDDSIPDRAARLQRVQESNTIPEFAQTLLTTDYVGDDAVVPDYTPLLTTIENVRSQLQLGIDTPTLDAPLQTRLADAASQVSSLARMTGVDGEITATLRSLAADIQLVADDLLTSDSATDRLQAIMNTLDDVYTIFQTLHDAHQYLQQQNLVEEVPPETV